MNKSKKDNAQWYSAKHDTIDEASEETFPSSDSPAWTLGANKVVANAEIEGIHDLTHMLAHEHHVIRKVVHVIMKMIHAIQNEQRIDLAAFKNLVHLLHKYVEEGHEKKEELLYPALMHGENHPSDYLINDLKREHQSGHELLSELVRTVDNYDQNKKEAKLEFIKLMKEIHNLQHNHVAKEDEYIIPFINKILTPEEQKKLLDQFDKIDAKLAPDSGSHLMYLAAKLMEKLH